MSKTPTKRSDHEWFELITQARQSGLSDAEWCRQRGIPKSSFSLAAKRLREKAYAVPESVITNDNHFDLTSKQEVVKIDIEQDNHPANQITDVPAVPAVVASASHLDNSHTIEIQMGDTIIRLSNNANPALVQVIASSFTRGGHYAC